MKTTILDTSVFVTNAPCVTICMNTPGYQSDNSQLYTELSRLVEQAKFLVLEKYGNLPVNPILEKLDAVPKQISFEDHIKSLTVYVQESSTQIVFSMWPVAHNRAQVSDRFDIRPLVSISNNTEEYNILLLSHKKIKLLRAVNNKVVHEIKQGGFPITNGLRLLAPNFKSKNAEDEEQLHSFFNRIDSALIKLYNVNGFRYIVASTSDNYERFRETISFQSLYLGHIPLSGDLTYKNIASEAWALIQELQKKARIDQIKLVGELIGQGKAITGSSEIVKAAREGRGDLLVVNDARLMTDEDEELVCETVWDVARRRGKVVLAECGEAEGIGTMVLKLKS